MQRPLDEHVLAEFVQTVVVSNGDVALDFVYLKIVFEANFVSAALVALGIPFATRAVVAPEAGLVTFAAVKRVASEKLAAQMGAVE